MAHIAVTHQTYSCFGIRYQLFVLHATQMSSTDFFPQISTWASKNFVSELIRNFSGKIVRMKQLEEVHGELSPADFCKTSSVPSSPRFICISAISTITQERWG